MNRRSFFAASTALAGGALCSSSPAFGAPAPESQFHLGCVTYNLLKDMDVETIIKTLETTGVSAVELRTGHKHGVEPSLSPTERAQIKDRFARSKVRLLSYGTTCEFQAPDPAERKRQIETGKAFVDLARDTNALAIKVRPNGFPRGVPQETTIQTIAGGLRELGEYAQTKGIEVWMEVHGTGTMEPRVSADILRSAAHKNVFACWNSNPTDVKDGSVKQSFELLKPYIRSAHITELYSGYPYQEFFRLLRESGYQRYTLAEVPESADPVRFLHYYKALWEQLQR